MKLEVGKYYRTRDGRKAKVIKDDGSQDCPCLVYYVDNVGLELWCSREGVTNIWDRDDDIIAEWTETPEVGPVRTVTTTKREIVPGVYGRVIIGLSLDGDRVAVGLSDQYGNGLALLTSDELTDAIATLTAIRGAMQANTTA